MGEQDWGSAFVIIPHPASLSDMDPTSYDSAVYFAVTDPEPIPPISFRQLLSAL